MRLQLGRPTDLISTLQNGGTKTTTTKLKKQKNKDKKQRPQNLGYFHILWIEK